MKTMSNLTQYGLSLAVAILACLPTASIGAEPIVTVKGGGFEVTPSEGGPGVGGFVDSDCVVTGDLEVVTRGHMQITRSGQSVAATPELSAIGRGHRGRCSPHCVKYRGRCYC